MYATMITNAPSPSETFFNPENFAATFLKILDNEKCLIPLRYNAAQKYFLANRGKRNLVIKSRQLGLSTLLQAEMFRYVTTGSSTTLTLTHLDSTTQGLRRMADRFYENLPSNFRPKRKYANADITSYPDFNSEAIIATAGNVNNTRSFTFSHVHLSEACFYKDAGSILASIESAIPDTGTITIETTANGAMGHVFDLVQKALGGDDEWKLFFFGWWWEPKNRIALEPHEVITYTDEEFKLVGKHNLIPSQIKWRRKMQSSLGVLFQQEQAENVNTAFLTSGNSVFGDFTHALHHVVTDAKPITGHYYVAGCDWGNENDWTVLSIIDCDTNEEVFLGRWRKIGYAAIRANILEVCSKWGVKELHPEKNSIGIPVIESLVNDMQERGLTFDVVPFTMTNDRKASMVAQLYTAIHEDVFKLLDYEWATAEMRQFISKQTPLGAWTYGAADGFHDDSVVARMAAKRAMARRI